MCKLENQSNCALYFFITYTFFKKEWCIDSIRIQSTMEFSENRNTDSGLFQLNKDFVDSISGKKSFIRISDTDKVSKFISKDIASRE